MISTLAFSLISAVPAFNDTIALTVIHSGDPSVHQKQVYADTDGILNVENRGDPLSIAVIDQIGLLVGIDETPGLVGVSEGLPSLKLYPDYTYTGSRFSFDNRLLSYNGESKFLICKGAGYQLWNTQQGTPAGCGDSVEVVITGIDTNAQSDEEFATASVGYFPKTTSA